MVAVAGPLILAVGLLIAGLGVLSTIIGAVLVPLGIIVVVVAAVIAGFVLFTGGVNSAEEGLEQFKDSLEKTEKALDDVLDINAKLKKSTEELKGANADLAIAIFDGGAAAINTAVVEVRAISKRILANRKLKKQYLSVLKIQEAILAQDAATAQLAFEKEFSPEIQKQAEFQRTTQARLNSLLDEEIALAAARKR
ncbi:MAG: hypothetical protein IIC56_11730, partial [Proteobacteria bacterium]|nr:hypothetical protein [Pseudomonadota bacterium]